MCSYLSCKDNRKSIQYVLLGYKMEITESVAFQRSNITHIKEQTDTRNIQETWYYPNTSQSSRPGQPIQKGV